MHSSKLSLLSCQRHRIQFRLASQAAGPGSHPVYVKTIKHFFHALQFRKRTSRSAEGVEGSSTYLHTASISAWSFGISSASPIAVIIDLMKAKSSAKRSVVQSREGLLNRAKRAKCAKLMTLHDAK